MLPVSIIEYVLSIFFLYYPPTCFLQFNLVAGAHLNIRRIYLSPASTYSPTPLTS